MLRSEIRKPHQICEVLGTDIEIYHFGQTNHWIYTISSCVIFFFFLLRKISWRFHFVLRKINKGIASRPLFSIVERKYVSGTTTKMLTMHDKSNKTGEFCSKSELVWVQYPDEYWFVTSKQKV